MTAFSFMTSILNNTLLKEKLSRFMSEAVKRKLIKIGTMQHDCANFENTENLTMGQILENPLLGEGVFHFGTCLNMRTPGLDPNTFNDLPKFSPYRGQLWGRCTHMYGMSHCAAKMIIRALHKAPAKYLWVDWLIQYLIANSPKLIGWWTDPPLGYQTSQIDVLGEIDRAMKERSYDPEMKQEAPR